MNIPKQRGAARHSSGCPGSDSPRHPAISPQHNTATMSCSCCSGETHKKETFEPFIDPAPLAKRCKLDNGDKKFSLPMVGVGQVTDGLQALPVECYQACLQYLDIATLTTMRRVSQFTRRTIDSLHPYRELYEHAPQAIRACLSTGVASHIPLLRLHNSLTSMECYYCKTAYVALIFWYLQEVQS